MTTAAEPQPIRAPVSREILEDRWRGAIDGTSVHVENGEDLFSPDGLELIEVLDRLILRVTRNQGADTELVDECIEAVWTTIIDRVEKLGIAR